MYAYPLFGARSVEVAVFFLAAAAVLSWLLFSTLNELRKTRKTLRRMQMRMDAHLSEWKRISETLAAVKGAIDRSSEAQRMSVDRLRQSVEDFTRQLFGSGGEYTPYDERRAAVEAEVGELMRQGMDEHAARTIVEAGKEPIL